MNVLFHVTVGAALVIGLSKPLRKASPALKYGLLFCAGVASHGVLDFIPHCYPIHSYLDVALSIAIILFLVFRAHSESRWFVVTTLFACVFPDVFDLAPDLIHKHLGISLWEIDYMFPWHFAHYSGSIYSGDCSLSNAMHFLVLTLCALLVFWNRSECHNLFGRKNG